MKISKRERKRVDRLYLPRMVQENGEVQKVIYERIRKASQLYGTKI
jgi:hypothetical protein